MSLSHKKDKGTAPIEPNTTPRAWPMTTRTHVTRFLTTLLYLDLPLLAACYLAAGAGLQPAEQASSRCQRDLRPERHVPGARPAGPLLLLSQSHSHMVLLVRVRVPTTRGPAPRINVALALLVGAWCLFVGYPPSYLLWMLCA